MSTPPQIDGSCCDGIGLAAHAAVSCPNPHCPVLVTTGVTGPLAVARDLVREVTAARVEQAEQDIGDRLSEAAEAFLLGQDDDVARDALETAIGELDNLLLWLEELRTERTTSS